MRDNASAVDNFIDALCNDYFPGKNDLDMHTSRYVFAALGLWSVVACAQSKIAVAPLPAPQAASPARAKITALLAGRTRSILKEAHECVPPGREDGTFESTAKVLLDTQQLYSVEVIGDNACSGAAHPDTWQYALTYDMTTGKRYDPVVLYRLGIPHKNAQVSLAPEASRLIRAALLSASGVPAECKSPIDDFLPNMGMTFGLSRQGLNVYFDAAHVMQACFVPITLPYARLARLLNPSEAARLHWHQ